MHKSWMKRRVATSLFELKNVYESERMKKQNKQPKMTVLLTSQQSLFITVLHTINYRHTLARSARPHAHIIIAVKSIQENGVIELIEYERCGILAVRCRTTFAPANDEKMSEKYQRCGFHEPMTQTQAI